MASYSVAYGIGETNNSYGYLGVRPPLSPQQIAHYFVELGQRYEHVAPIQLENDVATTEIQITQSVALDGSSMKNHAGFLIYVLEQLGHDVGILPQCVDIRGTEDIFDQHAKQIPQTVGSTQA